VHYNTVQHSTVQHSAPLYCNVLCTLVCEVTVCCSALHCAAPRGTQLCCFAHSTAQQCGAVVHNTVRTSLYCIQYSNHVLHSTVLFALCGLVNSNGKQNRTQQHPMALYSIALQCKNCTAQHCTIQHTTVAPACTRSKHSTLCSAARYHTYRAALYYTKKQITVAQTVF
jgi:hypothetical protein